MGKTNDTPDQHRLRETVGDQIEAIMKAHEIGGAVILVSEKSAAWRLVLPVWAFLRAGPEGLAMRIKTKRPEDRVRSEATIHMIGAVRDIAKDFHSLFAGLFRTCQTALEEHGSGIEHAKFGGEADQRPDKGQLRD